MSGFKSKRVIATTIPAGNSILIQQAIDRLMQDLNSNPITHLIPSEGRVYGSRYYCVEPIGGNWIEMEQWVYKVCGKPGDHMWGHEHDRNLHAPESDARWYMNNRKFWFRKDLDRTMFMLRWS